MNQLGMTCALCQQTVLLDELDGDGWSGMPAHEVCAQSARDAFNLAVDEIASRHRRLNDRLGKRYDKLAS